MVVFDRLLGDTHALDAQSSRLLEAWLSDPKQSLDEVAQQLGLSGQVDALRSILKPLSLIGPQLNG